MSETARMLGRQVRRFDGTVIWREFWQSTMPELPIVLDIEGEWIYEEFNGDGPWVLVATGAGRFARGNGRFVI